MLEDSTGWPCLRFMATKVRAEQLVPLSAKAAAAIRSQQDYVREHWPAGCPWLFPGLAGNEDGSKPYSHSYFSRQLAHWQEVIDLHDKTGHPVRVTAHQFRHTLGTRLKMSDVARTASFGMVRDQEPIRVFGFRACGRGQGLQRDVPAQADHPPPELHQLQHCVT